jgi:hypothetical protein
MTTRVQLIVTGELERLGLHPSLQRLFTSAGADVKFLEPLKTQDFTSNRVGRILTGSEAAHSLAAKLAGSLVASVHPGRGGTLQADLVLAVDDLELTNADQPEHVIDYFRHAVRACVEERYSAEAARERVYRALAERGSFHFLVPMAEAYFFGEPAALDRAKAHKAPNRFNAQARDVEDFEVDDPSYLAPAPPSAPWKVEPRHRHPKHYVRYLCDPTGQQARAYRETHEGLADALNIPSPCPGPCSPLTARGSGEGLLRNI